MRLEQTLLACSIVLVACAGSGSEAEQLIAGQADVMNDMAAVLESVDDASSAESAKPRMRALGERLSELEDEWQAYVASLGTEETAAQAYRSTTPREIAEAQARLSSAFTRLAMNPSLRNQMAELAREMGDAYQARR